MPWESDPTTGQPTYKQKGNKGGAAYQFGQWWQNIKGAEYAHDQSLQDWNRQNAYNHPQAQMERLKSAGLNPNLIYGDSASGAAGNAENIGKYQGAVSGNQGMNVLGGALGLLGQFQDVRIKAANAKKAEIEADAYRTDPSNIYQGIYGRNQQNWIGGLDSTMDYNVKEAMYNIDSKTGLPKKGMKISDNLYYNLVKGQKEATLKSTQSSARLAMFNAKMRQLDAKHYRWTKWVDMSSSAIGNIFKAILLKK